MVFWVQRLTQSLGRYGTRWGRTQQTQEQHMSTSSRWGDQLLTLPQIAELTGKSIHTIRWYRTNGIGPKTWRNGGRVVAWKGDVLEWLEEQEASSAVGGVQPEELKPYDGKPR